jgi:TonB family protein
MTLSCIVLLTVMVVPATAQDQRPPRDPRPIDLQRAASAVTERRAAGLRARIAAAPTDPAPRFELAKLQEDSGRYEEAEATLLEAKAALPPSTPLLHAIAGFYNRLGNFEKTIALMEEAARLDASNPQAQHLVGSYYQEKAAKDPRITAEQKRAYIRAGIDAEDRALALNPDYVDALVYKNILLRLQATVETDKAEQQRLILEADGLRGRAVELQKARGNPHAPATGGAGPAPAGPVPPQPPGAPGTRPDLGMAPVRVGGNVPAPTKTRHVNPVYPAEARDAGVQGVVICEVTLNRDGRVAGVRVLRSIPALDAAAVEAVSQWEFTPTNLNGEPVPVIMTVTVNFAL